MSAQLQIHNVAQISTEVRQVRASADCPDHDTLSIIVTDSAEHRTRIVLFMAPQTAGLGAITMPAPAKPFSTYPEDRAKMLALCGEIDRSHDYRELPTAVIELADLVKAILTDEAVPA